MDRNLRGGVRVRGGRGGQRRQRTVIMHFSFVYFCTLFYVGLLYTVKVLNAQDFSVFLYCTSATCKCTRFLFIVLFFFLLCTSANAQVFCFATCI